MRHESCSVPITALAYIDDYLLAGEGQYLRVFRGSELLLTIHVFGSQSIHGIIIQKYSAHASLVLLWGGCHVCIARFDTQSTPRIQLGSTVRVQDWLLDVALETDTSSAQASSYVSPGNARAAAVTAHNCLLGIKIGHREVPHNAPGEDKWTSLSVSPLSAQLESRSILYSAHLQWLDSGHILVAAGTAFGEILVWSCLADADAQKTQLHHVFTGHEGSIFGVRISQPLNVPGRGKSLRVLGSCSDDRTIRVWDISNIHQSISSSEPQPKEGPPQLRETGFGSEAHGSDGSSNSKPLAIAWGHASRIWGVRFLQPSATSRNDCVLLDVLSYGEDATCQSWHFKYKGDKRPTPAEEDGRIFSLEHTDTHSYHSGKHIWSIATREQQDGFYTVVTGAADGQIIACPASAEKCGSYYNDSLHMEQSMEDISSSMGQIVSWTPSDWEAWVKGERISTLMKHSTSFRSYGFLDKDSFLAITNTGMVLLAKLAHYELGVVNLGPLRWKMMSWFEGLKGYSVVTSLKDQGTGAAFFAGTNGFVYCYSKQCTDFFVLARSEGKVAAVFATAIETAEPRNHTEPDVPQQTFSLLTTSVASPTAHHYVVTLPSYGESSVRRSLSMTLPSGFVVTSMVNPTFTDGEEHLFLGGRNGSIIIFRIITQPDPSTGQSIPKVTHTRTLEQIHAKETVTAMLWIPASSDHISFGWLLTVGRDGSCTMLHFSRNSEEPSLVHKLGMPFGPNIEGVYLDRTSNDLMIYGFSGKHFVLYNASSERGVWSVECGGAHRVWAFHPAHDPQDACIQGGAFVWTKAGKMNVFSKHTPSHQIIRQGGHGREIKALAISPSSGVCGQLIATGAEDTDIRLFRYEIEQKRFRCLRILRKHVTGIQHLQWSDDGRFLFSSGGIEEFFVWRVSAVPVLGVGVVCEAICPPESEIADLRIMHFTARGVRVTADEARENDAFVIGMVYSDSTVRVYQYTSGATSKSFILLHTGNYLTSCLTQSASLTQAGEDTLLTAGTDGHIALWSLPQNLLKAQPSPESPSSPLSEEGSLPHAITWHTRTRTHQSTIKALVHHQLSPDSVMIVTGGDDNALGLTLIHRTQSAGHVTMHTSTLLIPRAHASAVTALTLIPKLPSPDASGSETCFTVVSSSNDQRIKVWDVVVKDSTRSVGDVEVKKVENVFTPVADVSSMDLLEDEADGSAERQIMLCGVGMDVWRLSADATRWERRID